MALSCIFFAPCIPYSCIIRGKIPLLYLQYESQTSTAVFIVTTLIAPLSRGIGTGTPVVLHVDGWKYQFKVNNTHAGVVGR